MWIVVWWKLLSSCASVESVLDAQFYATALLKYSQMRQHLLRFCLALTQNCSIENSLNLKQDKIVVFQGGRSMEYSRISRPTTQKNGYFTCFRRVRHWCNCLKNTAFVRAWGEACCNFEGARETVYACVAEPFCNFADGQICFSQKLFGFFYF